MSDLVEHMGIHFRSLYDNFGDKHTVFLKTQDCFAEFSCDYDAEVLAESLHNTLLGIRLLARTSASKEKLHRIADFSLALLNK